jgi:hypothetical protein
MISNISTSLLAVDLNVIIMAGFLMPWRPPPDVSDGGRREDGFDFGWAGTPTAMSVPELRQVS